MMQVLKHLTIKRPLDAERLHFYAQVTLTIRRCMSAVVV